MRIKDVIEVLKRLPPEDELMFSGPDSGGYDATLHDTFHIVWPAQAEVEVDEWKNKWWLEGTSYKPRPGRSLDEIVEEDGM